MQQLIDNILAFHNEQYYNFSSCFIKEFESSTTFIHFFHGTVAIYTVLYNSQEKKILDGL